MDQPEPQPGKQRRAADDFRTLEESVAAIRALTPEQHARLVHMAKPLLAGTRCEDRDLFHDVFVSIAAGRRRWPVGVDFVTFVHGAMKSVAFNLRRKARRVDLHPPASTETPNVLEQQRDPGPSPEACAELADLERRAHQALEGDELAQLLLMARVEGMSPKDFCEMQNISQKEFEAVSKRLQRRLQSRLVQGN